VNLTLLVIHKRRKMLKAPPKTYTHTNTFVTVFLLFFQLAAAIFDLSGRWKYVLITYANERGSLVIKLST